MKRLDKLTCLGCQRTLPRDDFDLCQLANGRIRPYERCRECRHKTGRYGRGRPALDPPNPSGLCMCGCGQVTPISTRNYARFGHVAGQHARYVIGHGSHVSAPEPYIIDEERQCWLWQRAKDKSGRGVIGVGRGKSPQRAHRVVYERHVGPIPDDHFLDHQCPNQGCVNPLHLDPVTHAENMERDRRRRALAGHLWLMVRNADHDVIITSGDHRYRLFIVNGVVDMERVE